MPPSLSGARPGVRGLVPGVSRHRRERADEVGKAPFRAPYVDSLSRGGIPPGGKRPLLQEKVKEEE